MIVSQGRILFLSFSSSGKFEAAGIESFCHCIWEISQHCELGASVDLMLRDKTMFSISDCELKEKLLELPTVTLEQ